MGYVTNPGVTGRDPGAFAGYDGGGYVDPDDSLEGIFGTLWGGVKKVGRGAAKVGGFAGRRVLPLAIGAIPVVGGAASRAYQGLVSPTTGRTTAGTGGTIGYRTPVGIAPQTQQAERSFLDRLRAAASAAAARAAEDKRVQEFMVSQTARYAPPQLLGAALARQGRAAPDWMKGGIILPALAVGALVLITARR